LHTRAETRVGIFVLGALAIFVYMGFKIGTFRFDRRQYLEYTLAFSDISGLSRKADVKIAGVKVGWVESVELLPKGPRRAQAVVTVHEKYRLYENAYGTVRQDGLLGPKYVELAPGDPALKQLYSGMTLSEPSSEPVSIDELMREFKYIAANVRNVSDAFKEAIGGEEGAEKIKTFVQDLSSAAAHVSSFSKVLENSFVQNEDSIDSFLQLGSTINRLVEKLETEVLPGFNTSIEHISDVFDRDFGRIATNVEVVAQSFDDAAVEARDSLHSISSIATKIDEGTGLVGKLINEDDTYRDFKLAIEGIRNYVSRIDRMQIVIDTHSETMMRPGENYHFTDAKGYFEARIYPREDYFFLIQYMNSEKGTILRTEKQKDYTCRTTQTEIHDPAFDFIYPDTLHLTDAQKLWLQAGVRQNKTQLLRDTGKLSIQVGKIFGDFCLRAGLFDGFAGLGADIDIPFRTDMFRWITTFEIYDMNGRGRLNNRIPHLKWLNKMYIMRHIYVTFGADDFISSHNSSAFYGVGLRFGDDDLKYLIGGFSGLFSGIGK
jgi:phospholipid/cholesterol/gamma-HCH transport system substrate-binding protein